MLLLQPIKKAIYYEDVLFKGQPLEVMVGKSPRLEEVEPCADYRRHSDHNLAVDIKSGNYISMSQVSLDYSGASP